MSNLGQYPDPDLDRHQNDADRQPLLTCSKCCLVAGAGQGAGRGEPDELQQSQSTGHSSGTDVHPGSNSWRTCTPSVINSQFLVSTYGHCQYIC